MASRDFDVSGHPRRVFGAMLRYYRTRAGMSQEELGARVYLSDDMICKVESGRRTLREEHTAACDEELNTGGALSELREQLKDMLKLRAYPGWFQEWPVKEAGAGVHAGCVQGVHRPREGRRTGPGRSNR